MCVFPSEVAINALAEQEPLDESRSPAYVMVRAARPFPPSNAQLGRIA